MPIGMLGYCQLKNLKIENINLKYIHTVTTFDGIQSN